MLSGLPRSGSTVLSSLLNQHSNIVATTTSPVADLMSLVIDTWPNISKALLNPNASQYGNILLSLLQGAHQHEIKNVVIDKNRLWPRLSTILYKTTNTKIKIICTVRNIPDIMASYIILFNKNLPNTNFVDEELKNNNLAINNKNRCKLLLEKYIGHPYSSLKIGYNSKCSEMLFLTYEEIVEKPQETIDRICEFINIETCSIKIDELKTMNENDEYHGGLKGLHDVRSLLKKTSPPAEEILGKDIVKYYTDMKLNFWEK